MALLFKILNRKCSCPLIFRNFLSKIFRKSKMGYAPHHLASQGAGCRSCRKRQFGKKSPRGEALTQGKASHFCRRKFCEQNFMQARGSREAADNFCLIVRKHDEARGSLDEGKDYPFCRRKFCEKNFMQARGRL